MKTCQGSRALPGATAMALPPFSAVKLPQSISALSRSTDSPSAAHQTSLESLGSSLVRKAANSMFPFQ